MKLTLNILVQDTFEAHATNDGISVGQAVDNLIRDCVASGNVPHSLTIDISEDDKKAFADLAKEMTRDGVSIEAWRDAGVPKPRKGSKVDHRV